MIRSKLQTFCLLNALITAVFTSCGGAPLQSKLSIIGGAPTKDSRLDPVVAIIRDELTICSGTLISSDLVLTAAHCLEKAKRPNSNSLQTLKIITGSSTHERTTDKTFEITDAQIHPKFWNDHRGAFDFAWIKLDRPVTGIEPARIPLSHRHVAEKIKRSKNLIIAGFGLSTLTPPASGEEPKIGVKLKAESPIKFRTGVEVFAGNHSVDSCSGDSGGPAFVESRSTDSNLKILDLVGVTSRGPMPCASDYEAGAYGLVSEAICWLRSTANYRQDDPDLADFCVREAARGATTDDDRIILEQSFMEACQSPDLSEASRHDLMQLFEITRVPAEISKERCGELRDIIQKASIIDLSSRHLRQLTWLRHATALEVLLASDNMLEAIRGVENLKKLTLLDVRNNAITNTQGLERMGKKITVFGAKTQMKNIDETRYREIAEQGAAAGSERRTLIIALRDMLAAGDIARKSRDLALKRQLNLDARDLRSIEGLRDLENLVGLSIANNPDIKDWHVLLTLPRLGSLRYTATDGIPIEVIDRLKSSGTTLIPVE